MKNLAITSALCVSLCASQASTNQVQTTEFTLLSAPHDQPQPQILSLICTLLALGVFGVAVWSCWNNGIMSDHLKTNAPPVVPPCPTNNPSTNGFPTNIYPAIPLVGTVHYADASDMGYTNPDGSRITIVTALTIESASTPFGPWSNTWSVISWQSQGGSLVLLSDSHERPLLTNWSTRTGTGQVINQGPALDMSEPAKFYRVKP